MVRYLVTTRLEKLEECVNGAQVFMVDGTVPGWQPTDLDHHFDHHRPGGADIQIDEMPLPNEKSLIQEKSLIDKRFEWYAEDQLIVTTQIDADACVAAAWLQLSKKDLFDDETLNKLRAIAYDCDHLGVPESLAKYADFAAQCVAALKSDSDKLISELGLPKDRKTWNIEQKEEYASLDLQKGTEALISACKGEGKFPGECGEAAEYWEKVENNTMLLLPN